MKQPDKKVDLSWKEQIERERATEQRKEQPPSSSDAGTADGQATARQPETGDGARAQVAPTFPALVTQLAMQAMLALGLVRTPDGHVPEPDLEQARYIIDLIGVLDEKTDGNLTDEEQRLLSDTKHDLQMAFVNVSGRP